MHTRPNESLLRIWRDRLSSVGYSTDLDGLLAATRAEPPDVRGIAFALIGVEGHREALDAVLAGLSDPYPPARAEAARAAVLLGERSAAATLSRLLDVDWPETALNAAAYLADLGDPSGWEVVAEAAASDLEALRLQAALVARAFSVHDEAAVLELLRAAALEDRSALVRREAVGQVAGFGDAAARQAILRRAADDADRRVARAARARLAEEGA